MTDDVYKNFSDLQKHNTENIDYKIEQNHIGNSKKLIVAPHGGKIEENTSEIAKGIAGGDFSFYCFSGIKKENNGELHITSSNFDEPSCLALLEKHTFVFTIHGCTDREKEITLGGLDAEMITRLDSIFQGKGFSVDKTGGKFPGRDKNNICNRGTSKKGVQFELTKTLRLNKTRIGLFVSTLRDFLKTP